MENLVTEHFFFLLTTALVMLAVCWGPQRFKAGDEVKSGLLQHFRAGDQIRSGPNGEITYIAPTFCGAVNASERGRKCEVAPKWAN